MSSSLTKKVGAAATGATRKNKHILDAWETNSPEFVTTPSKGDITNSGEFVVQSKINRKIHNSSLGLRLLTPLGVELGSQVYGRTMFDVCLVFVIGRDEQRTP